MNYGFTWKSLNDRSNNDCAFSERPSMNVNGNVWLMRDSRGFSCLELIDSGSVYDPLLQMYRLEVESSAILPCLLSGGVDKKHGAGEICKRLYCIWCPCSQGHTQLSHWNITLSTLIPLECTTVIWQQICLMASNKTIFFEVEGMWSCEL